MLALFGHIFDGSWIRSLLEPLCKLVGILTTNRVLLCYLLLSALMIVIVGVISKKMSVFKADNRDECLINLIEEIDDLKKANKLINHKLNNLNSTLKYGQIVPQDPKEPQELPFSRSAIEKTNLFNIIGSELFHGLYDIESSPIQERLSDKEFDPDIVEINEPQSVQEGDVEEGDGSDEEREVESKANDEIQDDTRLAACKEGKPVQNLSVVDHISLDEVNVGEPIRGLPLIDIEDNSIKTENFLLKGVNHSKGDSGKPTLKLKLGSRQGDKLPP